jgi:hypothetical protein
MGFPFCVGLVFRHRARFLLIFFIFSAFGLPFLATGILGLFYQKLVWGYLLLLLTVIPLGLCRVLRKGDALGKVSGKQLSKMPTFIGCLSSGRINGCNVYLDWNLCYH